MIERITNVFFEIVEGKGEIFIMQGDRRVLLHTIPSESLIEKPLILDWLELEDES